MIPRTLLDFEAELSAAAAGSGAEFGEAERVTLSSFRVGWVVPVRLPDNPLTFYVGTSDASGSTVWQLRHRDDPWTHAHPPHQFPTAADAWAWLTTHAPAELAAITAAGGLPAATLFD